MIITGDDIDGILFLKIELARQFKMKDFSYLRYFLGIEIAYSPRGYLLSQSKYVAYILERARLTDNKILNTPIEVNIRYSSYNDLSLSDPSYTVLLLGAWYILLLLVQILHMLFILLVSLLLFLLLFIG